MNFSPVLSAHITLLKKRISLINFNPLILYRIKLKVLSDQNEPQTPHFLILRPFHLEFWNEIFTSVISTHYST